MNSTSVRKRRRKVIALRRKLNSTTNKSLSLLSIGNNKRKNIALKKNNKNLALALQDARCELSTKQKLLENATKHLKNMMQARINMLEIYSSLKSIMKKFDAVIFMLDLDDTKISDLTAPFQSCSKFKSQMKKLAETIEKVPEEDSFSIEQERFDELEANFETAHGMQNFAQDCVENTCFVSSKNIADKVNPVSSVLFCENSEGVRNPCKEKPISPTKKNDSLKDRESSGTPKLSIPNIILQGVIDPCKEKQISPTKSDSLKDSENSETPRLSISNIAPLFTSKVSSNCKTCIPNEKTSSLVENASKTLNSSELLSKKALNSKIPRFNDMPVRAKKESNSSNVVSKGKTLYEKILVQKKLNVPEESDVKICHRKTFVVRLSDALKTNPESTVALNQEEVLDENNSDVENSEIMSRRKTFVVKNSGILENSRKSLCDRRKTYVKKSEGKDKALKSTKSRRGTFVLSEIKENCTSSNENAPAAVTENLVDDIQKKSFLPSNEMKVTEELTSICNNVSESSENSQAFQKKLVHSEISDAKLIPLQNHCQGKKNTEEANESTQEVKESKSEKDNSNVEDIEEGSLKAGKLDEGMGICNKDDQKKGVEISDIDAICQGSVQNVIESDEDDIEILDTGGNVGATRSRRRISYKKFLESSDSDCESISDLDLQSFKVVSPVKSFPVRGKFSGSKKKKVFVFSTHKRKSVLNKKSLNKLPKIPKNNSEIYNDVPQSDSASIKNEDVSMNTIKNQKLGKSVTFDCTTNMCENETVDSTRDTSCDRQEMLQSTSTIGKNKKNVKNEVMNLDNVTSKLIVSNSEENINKNTSISLRGNYSPVITSDKSLNIIECESDNIDRNSKNSMEEHDINYVSKETKPNVKKGKVVKNSKVKSQLLEDKIPVDIISVKKKVKRNNSKKQSKEIITSDLREENMNDLLVKNEVKKGKNNKTQVKSKKNSTINMTESNTIVVQAEVHPPPRFLNIPENEVQNKKKTKKLDAENYEVSVVLSDIFQSKHSDKLTLSCKDNLVSNCRNFPLKTPLSDNSSNIVIPAEDSEYGKKEGRISSNFQEIRASKRVKTASYAEPSLRKKMRR